MSSPREIAGVILAGGESRRMGGGDKCLLDLGGQSMLDVVVGRIKQQLDILLLSANGDPDRYGESGLPVVADAIPGSRGPLAGIHAGMGWIRQNHPQVQWLVTVAADTPFFPSDLVERLLSAAKQSHAAVILASSFDRLHPVFGLWKLALFDELDRSLKIGSSGSVLRWAAEHSPTEVDFTPRGERGLAETPDDPFFNINRPEDLNMARAFLQQNRSTLTQ